MTKVNSVDEYIQKHPVWAAELSQLRNLCLAAGYEEAVKWSAPAYLKNGKILVGIAAFKNYVALWFHHGVFLSDYANKLLNANEENTRGLRQWRFESGEDLAASTEDIGRYLQETLVLAEQGKMIQPRQKAPLIIPEILQNALNENGLNETFHALNLTKKREFVEHLTSAKREATQLDRLAKILPLISEGKGLNDRYRK